MTNKIELKIAFFGTPEFAIQVFDDLYSAGIQPTLVVTQPDKPAGRKLALTPPPVKNWSLQKNISLLQPEKLNDDFKKKLEETDWDLFIVAAYGLIVPQNILDIPKYGTLNIHPSLLPKHRGATPIQQAILEDDGTGVTIMVMDSKMDHGDILVQEKTTVESWPPTTPELMAVTATQGAKMIIDNLQDYIQGDLLPQPQEHEKATFTDKIIKKDGLIDLLESDEKNFRKIQAYSHWPRTYFFTEKQGKDIRVIITSAKLINGKLHIERVVPEGKKEIDYKDFLKNK